MGTKSIHTAVILARGLGTRMRAAAEGTELREGQAEAAARGTKGMIDVGRPFLDHVISAVADAGIGRICLVIGPEHHEIRDYYSRIETRRTTIGFAVQQEPLGTGDAVLAAAGAVGDEPFVVLNSDNYYPASALRLLQGMSGCGLVGFDQRSLVERGNIPAERVRSFALLQVSPSGHLESIVEKPAPDVAARLGPDALVSMNCYRFTHAIFPYLRSLAPSSRGEYELTDAVRAAVASGEPFDVARSTDGVLDLSTRNDIAGVEAALRGSEVQL